MSSRDELPSDRKSGRPEDTLRPSDYDAPLRNRPRTSYSDESRTIDRYPSRGDEYERPSKYDDRVRISPSRTGEEAYISGSSGTLFRSRDDAYESGSSIIDGRKRDDDRYSSSRDRSRYYDDDIRREGESRHVSPSSVRKTVSTRRDINGDSYRTRSPDDRKLDDVGSERRSYSEEEEEEYRRQNPRTRYRADTDRIPSEGSRRDYRPDDDYYRSRTVDDGYRRSGPRGDYDTDIARGSDRYDRPIADDDRPSRRYPPEKDEPRRRSNADVGPRKESYPRDEDRALLRRPEGRPPAKDRRHDEDIPPRRTMYDDTIDDRPPRPTIDRASEDGRRRYKDGVPSIPDDSPRRAPLRSEKREPFVGSSSSSRDAVLREEINPNSERRSDDSGVEERPINAKDVIEAALKLPDEPNQNPREVFYPVYDPRSRNLTATDTIPRNAWRGTTLRRRRSRPNY